VDDAGDVDTNKPDAETDRMVDLGVDTVAQDTDGQDIENKMGLDQETVANDMDTSKRDSVLIMSKKDRDSAEVCVFRSRDR
jgi:hypothetical protein